MNNIIETKILTTSTTLAICMVGWVKPEKQQQILLNDLMSNGHKRYINTTDWQTIENINNRDKLATHLRRLIPIIVQLQYVCCTFLIDTYVFSKHKTSRNVGCSRGNVSYKYPSGERSVSHPVQRNLTTHFCWYPLGGLVTTTLTTNTPSRGTQRKQLM